MKQLVYIIVVIMLMSVTCNATIAEKSDEIINSLDTDELYEMIPHQASELLKNNTNIFDLSFKEVASLTPKEFLIILKSTVMEQIEAAIKPLALIISTVLLTAMLGTLGGKREGAEIFNTVSMLAVTLSISNPVIACIKETSIVIKEASQFLMAYIPVYTTVIIAGGSPATAAGYNMSVMAAAQLSSQMASQLIIPLMGIFLALCIAGSIASSGGVVMLSQGIKGAILTALTVMMTLFVGFLSLQGFMTGAADTAAVKASRFLVGSFVPVVGGAIADAMATAGGCMGIIKATVGSFGIVIAVISFLPILMKVLTLKAVVFVSQAVSEVLGISQNRSIMSGFSNALTILLALLISMALLIIISTAIMLSVGRGL